MEPLIGLIGVTGGAGDCALTPCTPFPGGAGEGTGGAAWAGGGAAATVDLLRQAVHGREDGLLLVNPAGAPVSLTAAVRWARVAQAGAPAFQPRWHEWEARRGK